MDSPEIVVIGSANVDLVTRVERLPAPGETVLATGYAEHPGGKGANQAIAAARLGRAVSFVGVVGDDGHGALLTQALVAEGVDVAYLRRLPGVPTGRALVLVDDQAENSIVVVSGANAELRAEDVSTVGRPAADRRCRRGPAGDPGGRGPGRRRDRPPAGSCSIPHPPARSTPTCSAGSTSSS